MVGGAHSWYNQITYLLGGRHTNWRIIISQKFSHRSESLEPYVKPQAWGFGTRRRSPQSIWFEGQWGLIEGNPQDWEKWKLQFWRVHTRSLAHQDPGKKQWLHRGLGQTYLLVLEGLLGRQWEAVSLSGVIKAGGGNIHKCSALKETDIFLESSAPRPGPIQQPVVSSAGTPQAKQPTGKEHSRQAA